MNSQKESYNRKMILYILCDHPPEPQMTALQKFLVEKGHDITQYSQKTIIKQLKKQVPDGLVVYVHGIFKSKVESRIIKYCLEGGRLAAVHHAIASAKMRNKKWLPFTGIKIIKDGSQRSWRVLHEGTVEMVNLRREHFITTYKINYDKETYYESSVDQELKGNFPAFTLQDTELFLNQLFLDKREKVILMGHKGYDFNDDPEKGTHLAEKGCWYEKRGKGLLFHVITGHATRDFENANFCQLILNFFVMPPDLESQIPRPKNPRIQ